MRIRPITMKGVDREDLRLQRLGSAVITTIADEAISASARLVMGEWIRIAPYDPRVKPKSRTLKSGERVSTNYGHGRDNIKVAPVRARKRNAVVYKLTTGDAFWLHIYEYGKFDQAPRPVFRAATERLRDDAQHLQTDIFTRGVSAAWAK